MACGFVRTLLAGMVSATFLAGCGAKLLDTGALSIASSTSVHPEGPIEIYSRVARGALPCWFGAQGSLKKTHIFHADVAPESKGGATEIVIHEKDPAADSPRSLRAYKISIAASGSGSQMTGENLKMPADVAAGMRSDLLRWAKGETGCSVVGTGGWGASAKPGEEPPPEPPSTPAKVSKPKRKT